MSKKIIIQIAFNIMSFNKVKHIDHPLLEINEEWLRYRIKIFTDYTLKSLKAQINQDFDVLIRSRDETRTFLKKEMNEFLPDNIKIVGVEEYHQRVKELSRDYDYLYLIRMDSDDMYIKTFVDLLNNYTPKPETEVLICQNVYIYDTLSKRLATFYYPSPTPYTFIYKTKDYLEDKRYQLKGGHAGAILLKYEIISGINYVWINHERNALGHFHKIKKETEITDNVKEILRNFGLFEKE